jgi:ArsR family transcriptional regulator, arsenate/arsenite/antimonite-responsive transcriptional repressor
MNTARIRRTKKKLAVKMPGLDHSTLSDLVEIFKSLSDENRLQIVFLLATKGEMNVTEICDCLGGQSQPAVSHHLTQLKHAKLVESLRDGKFNFYMLDSSLIRRLITQFFPSSGSAQQKASFGDLELTFKAK